MAAIIRLKRKACDEPANGLVIALKKSKYESSDAKEVLFKFAATLNSEKESVRDHIQAALSKKKEDKHFCSRNPKNTAISENKVSKVREKLLAEHKSVIAKKKLDYLNNKRLILAEEFQDLEDNSFTKDAEVRRLFHLYDIIEENEDVRKQSDEMDSIILCNDEPLIREKIEDYVFDVYIANGHIDQTFVDETVSVRPCTLTDDDIYFGESDESEECYEDDDDSNDENNYRNDYPEEENSNSEKSSLDSDAESYTDDHEALSRDFDEFHINDDDDDDCIYRGSRILNEVRNEYDYDAEDDDDN